MIAFDDRQFGPGSDNFAQGPNLAASISRAAEIAAHTRNHSIADVEHVVVLALRNRSFDHCFGTLNGVRGFSDPRVAQIANGKPQWLKASAGIERDPCPANHVVHGLGDDQGAGVGMLSGVAAMSYLTRVELPFLFALADAFTICDAYYGTTFDNSASCQSLLGPPSCGVDNLANLGGRQQAAISSTVYRDGGPPQHGLGDSVFDVLREDVICARLAQVSWLSLPDINAKLPERPGYDSAWDIAQVLDALTANPDVWSRTVLFINAAQAGGYFDHLVPPAPFAAGTQAQVGGDDRCQSDFSEMAMRAPMLVVSPWSRGGYVNSQVFDHSSVMRFIERRFGRHCQASFPTPVMPWRSAVAGDLTSAFNFGRPNAALLPLPRTVSYLPARKAPYPDDIVIGARTVEHPRQERGVRRTRALPYRLEARGMLQPMADNFVIEFSNRGQAAAVFRVCASRATIAPRSYTVEAGDHLKDSWALAADGHYDFTVHGPNGFLRAFKGRVLAACDALLEAHIECRHERRKELLLSVANFGKASKTIRIRDNYTGDAVDKSLSPDDILNRCLGCTPQFGWYDLVVTSDEDANFCWQFAGHIEDGRDSVSDPALGRREIEACALEERK